MSYTIDKYDLKLLEKLRDEGASFLKHPSHEFRASGMKHAGYIDGEMAVFKMNASSGTMALRWRYTINDKGRALLKQGLPPKAASKPASKKRSRPTSGSATKETNG